jgi:hypothetical protein
VNYMGGIKAKGSRGLKKHAHQPGSTPKSRFRTEWAQAFCLKCGQSIPMIQCIAPKPMSKESWLAKYPKSVVRKIQALDADHGFFHGDCPGCGTPICVAVENMIMPLRGGGFAVRFRGEWCLIGEPTRRPHGPRRVTVKLD